MLLRHSFILLMTCLLKIHSRVPVLILARLIHGIDPHLIQINEENDIITEAGNTMQDGHLDDEREHVINEGIQRLVDHRVDGNMGHTLQLVVNEQLRRHRDETCPSHLSPAPTEQIH